MLQVFKTEDGLFTLGSLVRISLGKTKKKVMHPSRRHYVMRTRGDWVVGMVKHPGTKTWKTEKGAQTALDKIVAEG